mgnify:FL=1
MPFQQATKNRFLQFDIKVTTESGFIMYKNNKPGREPFSRDNYPPAVLNHQHTASRSRLV